MKYSISILAYQNLSLTKKCIESVIANSGPASDWELILTDNGCVDGTKEYFDQLAATHHNMAVVHNEKNEGFIQPNRGAFRWASGKFLVLLNNDTVVPPNWLQMLAAPFAVDPKCAMSGPSGACCQLRVDFHGEMGPRFEYLEGSMLMMRRSIIQKIEPDLFPPELEGAYGEDSYLSLRCREMGYNLTRVNLPYQHYRGATSALVPKAKDWQIKNHAFLQKRFKRYMIQRRFNHPIIVKRTAAWGDVLLTTPIIKALKKKWPMAQIMVETPLGAVFNGNPDVTHVGHTILQTMDSIVVNLDGAYEMRPEVNIVDAYAQASDLTDYDRVTKLYPNGGDREWACRMISGGGWVAVNPGPTGWAGKNWPMDRWQKVVERLQDMGKKVVLVGGKANPQFQSDRDMRGATSIAQLSALLGQCEMLVSVDNFILHAGQASGCPVVGLFGVTLGEYIFTDGTPHVAIESDPANPSSGIRHRLIGQTYVEDTHECMKTISVEMVMEGIKELHLQCPQNSTASRA